MRRLFSGLLLTLVLVGCGTPASTRERLKTIENYIVYYGTGRVDDLARYDLSIVQPDTLTSEELARLKAQGKLVVAYLSVGEVEPRRPWYNDGRVDLHWILGKDQNWGSYYIDAGQPGWQQLMSDLTGEFVAKGYDGVFLDTLDTVDVYPATAPGMVQLVRRLRADHPAALLVQNRGFSVVDQTAAEIDAIMFEDVSTTYDFATQEYSPADNTATVEELQALHRQTGLPILALDYAPPDNPGLAARAVKLARDYGFIPAVSVINLVDLPDYGIARGGPADVRVRQLKVKTTGQTKTIFVTVENVGLSDAIAVPLTIKIDDTELISITRDLPIGAQWVWRVLWNNAPPTAKLIVTANFSDTTPNNDQLVFDYAAEAVKEKPLLPPDQQ
jgi:uncharacterized protein (TIGR01370 family)